MNRVGFIGLGDQGGGMAHRLVERGIPTMLWARREAALDPFRDGGATFAASRAELGAACDVVGVCVVDDAGVEQVVLGDDGVLAAMAPGSLLVVHSTISLATCHALAAVAAERGVAMIDAPVSGGGVAAAAGELTVMVGGDEAPVEQARPALEAFGGTDKVIHLGPLGSGLLAKLVNNVLHAAHYALAQDAFTAGEALGLDVGALGKVLSVSSGRSYSLDVAVAMGGLAPLAGHVGPLLRKDVGIFEDLAAEHGAPTGALVTVADEALRYFDHPRGR